MKKTGLFKITMFVLLGMVLLSWIFSASYFNEGELVDLGMYQLGFFDFFQLLFASFEFQYFLQILILLVSIGALYGVLNKTGKYRAWIDRIANNFKGAELVFLLIVSFTVAALTSIFDYGLLLFIFFPLIISIILAMGYDKIVACLTTFGAMLIGTIGNTLGYSTSYILSEQLGIKIVDGMAYKLVLFVVSIAILFIFLAKAKRRKIVKNEDDDMFLGEKSSNKYSIAPIIITFSLLFIIMVVGCTNWVKTFSFEGFETLHEKITTWEINVPTFNISIDEVTCEMVKTPIFGKIIGNVSALGNWYYAEMSIVCLMAALFVGMFYKIKLSDRFEYMADGAKKMLKPALLVVFIYAVVYYAGNSMFYPTIAKYILGLTSKFNIAFSTLTMILGSFLHVDVLYLTSYVTPQIAAQDVNPIIISILSQGIHGVTMFIAPTSATIALGLAYLGVPYKEWVKRTWKFALLLLATVLAVTIAAMLII